MRIRAFRRRLEQFRHNFWIRFRSIPVYSSVVAIVCGIGGFAILHFLYPVDSRIFYPEISFIPFLRTSGVKPSEINSTLSFTSENIVEFEFDRASKIMISELASREIDLSLIVRGVSSCSSYDAGSRKEIIEAAKIKPFDRWPTWVRFELKIMPRIRNAIVSCVIEPENRPFVITDVERREMFSLLPLGGILRERFTKAIGVPLSATPLVAGSIFTANQIGKPTWSGGSKQHAAADDSFDTGRDLNLDQTGRSNVTTVIYQLAGAASKHESLLVVATLLLGISGQAMYELLRPGMFRRRAKMRLRTALKIRDRLTAGNQLFKRAPSRRSKG